MLYPDPDPQPCYDHIRQKFSQKNYYYSIPEKEDRRIMMRVGIIVFLTIKNFI
jgi:hypothetical protein